MIKNKNNKTGLIIKSNTFKVGNHKYIDIENNITNLTERYHLIIQEKLINSLSNYQLKRLIKLCDWELYRRESNN